MFARGVTQAVFVEIEGGCHGGSFRSIYGQRPPDGDQDPKCICTMRPASALWLGSCGKGRLGLGKHDLPAAGWRRGYAADCKSVKTGSIPVPASIYLVALLKN